MSKMKHLITTALSLCAVLAMALPAHALEYNINAPGDPEYGKPTSFEPVVTADGGAMKNEDLSKSAALIPPGFGTPTSYMLNTGEYLTPNLVPSQMAGAGQVNGNVAVVMPPSSGSTAAPGSTTATTSGGTGTGSYPIVDTSTSSQTFCVDGQRVQFEAYEIHGNNFVKLRDIGKAVDFGVTYDGATNTVHIAPASPYIEEVTIPAPTIQTAPAPHTITEETARASLARLKEQYPPRSIYPGPYISSSGGPYGVSNRNCAGWAILCSDAVFGDLPWRRIDRPAWGQIRPGDLVEYDDTISRHVVVVVSKKDGYIMTTESGTDQQVLWSGQYFRWWLEKQPAYILYTRYPE